MIIITGGAGFIGSNVVHELNDLGYPDKNHDLIIVDNLDYSDYPKCDKWKNIRRANFTDYLDKNEFLNWLGNRNTSSISNSKLNIVHMGATTNTNEKNMDYLIKNDLKYSRKLLDLIGNDGRMIYASSAATYGLDTNFSDSEFNLVPLNQYGYVKHLLDLEVKKRNKNNVVGFKFFNVYGPNEAHKGNMASPVYQFYNQLMKNGEIKVFYDSYPMARDFIYVKDCSKLIVWTLFNSDISGIYNVGTGGSRSWKELAELLIGNVITNRGPKPDDLPMFNTNSRPLDPEDIHKEINNRIKYEELPNKYRGRYQYYTCARINSLINKNAPVPTTKLEDGVKDYITNYLEKDDPHL